MIMLQCGEQASLVLYRHQPQAAGGALITLGLASIWRHLSSVELMEFTLQI